MTAACLAGVFLAISLLFALDAFSSWQKIHPGVTVDGIAIGGKARIEAKEILREKLGPKLKSPVSISYNDKSWSLSPDSVEFDIDYDRTIARAFLVGRRNGTVESLVERSTAWINGVKSPLVYRLDERSLAKYLDKVDEQIGEKGRDAGVHFKDTEPLVVLGKNGFEINQERAINEIRSAILSKVNRKVALKLRATTPEVTDEQAQEAARIAKKMVSKPVSLVYKDLRWTIEAEKITDLIQFVKNKTDKGYSYVPAINKEKLAGKIGEMTVDITVEPKNARFEVDGEIVRVVPGQNGRKINVDEAYSLLSNAINDGERTVYMSMMEVEPKLTTEKAKSYGIERKLASYTTYYNSSAASRVKNIHLFADAVDGTILAPSEVFSINENVGPRTAAKGYLEAPVIINGRLEPGIGGGICQAATTLFDAVYFSGLEILQRENHAFYISRYPAGLDATVSYGGPDLKFRNDTGYYVMIKFGYTADSVTAAIYGKDGLGTEVGHSTTPFSNFRGFNTVFVQDAELPKGQQVVTQEGVMGRDITAYRTVKRNGKVIRQDTFFSRYDPENAIVKVGTKEVPPTNQTTNTASGTNPAGG